MPSGSFSGIPWSVVNPAWQSWSQGHLSNIGTYLGPSPVPETMTNPQAQQAWGAVGGLMGQLQQGGAGAIRAAGAGQGQVQGYANQLAQLGGQLGHEFDFNLPYAQQALQQGFDPLNAQYNYYLQSLRDQTGAGLAASGLAGTPYGQEATGAAQAAFQNQWEMQRLQREQTAAQTAQTLEQPVTAAMLGAGQLIDDAGNLDLGAMQSVLQAYGLQGSNLAAATQAALGLLNSLKISVATSS